MVQGYPIGLHLQTKLAAESSITHGDFKASKMAENINLHRFQSAPAHNEFSGRTRI